MREGAYAVREMKGVWKELQQRGDRNEDAPLTGSRSSAKAVAKASEDEADLFDSGFALREIPHQFVNLWLAFQAIGFLFQLLLWREVSGHLADFEDIISRECSAEHLRHGVCVGPMWNVSAWEDAVLSSASLAFRDHTWQFSTTSSPPTFLIIVDPVSKATKGGPDDPAPAPKELAEQTQDLQGVHWSLEVKRLKPPHVGPALHRYHTGQEGLTFEDLSTEAEQELAMRGRVEWKATLKSRISAKTRFVAFVEDAVTPHLAEIHASPQCAFGRSWKAFNMQRQGHRHKALIWCRFLLGIFLFVGGAAVYAVHSEVITRKGQGGKFRFHVVVLAKYLLQDMPQQICIVLYLFGWYEAYGLRCQLCLFDPKHCSAEDAFHFVNLVALAFTLLSALSNQLLIRAVVKKAYTEDDICIQYCVRVGGICLSVLPFTSGLCWASRSLIPMPKLVHILVAVPCGIGWLTLAGVICIPIMEGCDECDDD